MTHDPLCDWTEDPDPEDIFCHCALIARVRADERERHHDGGDCECTSVYADGTWLHASRNEAALRAQIAADIEALKASRPWDAYPYSEAARIARGEQ